MAVFNVTQIIDGATIEVGGWQWGENISGTKVKIVGLTEIATSTSAKSKLEILLKGKNVELTNPQKYEGSEQPYILYASVFVDGVDVTEYFPELKTNSKA